ncbi:MAG: hypothetical protein FWE59_03025, partial [Oscillospiraceae bacterium]|nr:hypothetical protein [Oscillospiraceae bacterium]
MKTRRQILSVLIALTLLLSMGFFAAPPALADPIVAAAAADDDSFRRPINSDNPLLMITVPMGHNYAWDPAFRRDVNYRAQDFKQIWTQIPEDVRPYVGLVLHFGAVYNRIVSVVEARDWIEHNVAAAGQLDIPVYLIYGGTRSRAMVTLNAGDPDIAVRGQDRWAFLRYLYETYPNFCGTTTSEQTGDNVVTDTTLLVELAAQYGGHHIYSSQEHQNVLEGGSQLNSQSGYDRMKAVGKHLIWVPKRMRNSNNYDDSLGMGMVLDGVAGGWGPYFDGYNWRPQNYFGYGISWADCRSRLMPELDSARYMIDAAMNGATVIHFENQMDLPATNSILTPLFWQSVLPAFRYMLAIDIPDREALFEMSNIAFSNHRVALKTLLTGGTSTTTINTDEPGCFDFYEGLYEILKGHNDNTGSNLSHFGRSSGRYGMIPILPKFASAATRARFEDDPGKLLLTSDNYRTLLPDLAAKVALFDTYYPEVSTGELTVQKGKTKDGA